jgi:type I site-specific restriction-modification system R (restriction) subunit
MKQLNLFENDILKQSWDCVITTYTGKIFSLLDPKPEDIDILDIAHAAARLCRFTGHVKKFASVAQHSVLASRYVDPKFALYALLHDASEPYISDISSPLKRSPEMFLYRQIEKNIMNAICLRFNLSPEEPKEVKEADMRMLVTEKRDLTNNNVRWPLEDLYKPFNKKIKSWSPKKAERKFLERFAELCPNG